MRLLIWVMMTIGAAGVASAQSVHPKSVAALDAIQSGWDVAYQIAEDADPVTADLLTWLRLRDGTGTFAEFRDFLTRRADWPGQSIIRAQAERAIVRGENAEAIIAWFEDAAPRTGKGAIALARAHIALDQADEGRDVLRDAWIGLRLSDDGQKAMYDAFGPQLEPFHAARTDALLWRGRAEDAARMLPLMEEDARALAAARIGYITRASGLPALMRAVPRELREDAGLAYARYSWLAARGERTKAVEMLLDRSTSRAALGEPLRWSGWRRVLARWEMREGRAEQAYTLASRHYLSEGAPYADLEWLSGYIALTYLGDPAQALTHFENGLRASSSPISLGRMQYWIGRAHEVKGNVDAAATAFGEAAAHQTSFYGLLASEKVGRPLRAALAGSEVIWEDASVFEDDAVKAAMVLLAGGERGAAVTFFAHLGRTLDTEELAQVGAYLSDIDEQYYALLLGKSAVRAGQLVPNIYFPVHDLAEMDLPADPALSLSIARRESEFNIGIGSPVGALGLMQLMPATAQEVAGNLGLPYARGRLTNDWRYNATLGANYLAYLEDEFGRSPVMIAAGYNAGPSRPKRWMDERGDPRLLEMDVVDWIEHIPFRETRNYVMRVTESIPVYQARLTGDTGPVRFTELLIGSKPLIRPRARPLPQDEAAVTPAVRPIARP
ncbi:lytic transglycosylase domain-containing protein [Yoonia sp. F2084L]|uniref:lytic transglycosylase domain-containing protein n=1 Tax=Yoonia sp. F2084L TaxID=2926419 RepID=UPI001FF6DA47|nr:lytic transglycosylase domain-containing protein [Yoonia sp. F2084L]MCK0095043.1 lytic transglycosylase domain-containing protein [Yoonia sp. F2084L]